MLLSLGFIAAAAAGVIPNYVVRFVNSRANGGLGGAYVDADGNAYITASNSNGGYDGGQITQKVAPNNSVLWSWTYPNAYGGEVGLHADSSGNIYTGGFHGQGGGDYYLYVVKYSPDGTRQWQRWFGGSVTYPDWTDTNATGHSSLSGGAFTGGNFILLDSNGSVVFSRSGNLGGESGEGGYIAGIGPSRVFFGHRKRFNVFSLTGGFQFGKAVGTNVPRGTFDNDNNLYLWHCTQGDNIMYVTKFGPTGTKIWDRQITASSGIIWNSSHGVCDSSGNLYFPIGWEQTSGTNTTQKIAFVSFDTNGNLRYQRAVDVANARDAAGQLNINQATGIGTVAGYMNGNNAGGFATFNLVTGSAVPTSAVAGGVTVSFYNPGFTITTPASLSYSDVGDIGGSSGVSTPNRGSTGGNSQYTISRGTFG
jgi:hypothetical protein